MTAELLDDDIYHYASSSYQFGRLSPPPPAPSSPIRPILEPDNQLRTSSREVQHLQFSQTTPTHQRQLNSAQPHQVHMLHQASKGDNRYSQQGVRQNNGGHCNPNEPQEGFMSLVYQAPSLHDVDEPNMVRQSSLVIPLLSRGIISLFINNRIILV